MLVEDKGDKKAGKVKKKKDAIIKICIDFKAA